MLGSSEEDQCRMYETSDLRYLTAMLVDVTLGVIVSWMMVRFFDILFGKLNWDVSLSTNLGYGQRQLLRFKEDRPETGILY